MGYLPRKSVGHPDDQRDMGSLPVKLIPGVLPGAALIKLFSVVTGRCDDGPMPILSGANGLQQAPDSPICLSNRPPVTTQPPVPRIFPSIETTAARYNFFPVYVTVVPLGVQFFGSCRSLRA